MFAFRAQLLAPLADPLQGLGAMFPLQIGVVYLLNVVFLPRLENAPADLNRNLPSVTIIFEDAAHANAAMGEPVLWLVGVDETGQVVGASQAELSNWWAQVASEFDGLAPAMQDVIVPFEQKNVLALCFETDRRPFVVKSGANRLEVPWREGTSTRSANRADLLPLLAERVGTAELQMRMARLYPELVVHDDDSWRIDLQIYIIPERDRPIVFPRRQCACRADYAGGTLRFSNLTFDPLVRSPLPNGMIDFASSEIICRGPGMIKISAANSPSDTSVLNAASSVNLVFEGKPVRGELISIGESLDREEGSRRDRGFSWYSSDWR